MWFFSARKTRFRIPNHRGRYSHAPRLEALEDRCVPSAGALDPTFNPAGNPPGTATVAVGTNSVNWGTDVLVQPSGKIVVTGYSGGHFSAAEFDSNGSLASNFGAGGTVITSSQGNSTPAASYAATLCPTGSTGDKKILEVGYGTYGDNNDHEIALVRFNTDGSLDNSFGKGGIVFTNPSQGTYGGATGVVLQPNGTSLPKIVVVAANAASVLELVRYNPDGSLDKTFGSNGVVYTPFNGYGPANYNQLALDPVTGDLIVAGTATINSTTNESFLVAYTPNGALDTHFGSGGIVSWYTSSAGGSSVPTQAEVIQPNGYIVTAWSGPGATFDLARYSPSGVLDSSFGNGGVVTTPIPGSYKSAYVWALALQSNGQIVAGGEVDAPNPDLFALARYNPNGSLDTTFGTSGIVTTQIGGSFFNEIRGLALQPNGAIVAAGSMSANPGQILFAVARYLPSEPQISSIAATSPLVTSGSNTTLTASNITDGNPGATITQVAFYVQINGSNMLLGYATESSPDVWTLTFTVNLASGSYTLLAEATDSDGIIGDSAFLNLTVS